MSVLPQCFFRGRVDGGDALGAINFNLHFWVWFKRRSEIVKNFESRVFALSLFTVSVITFLGLRGIGSLSIFRKGFFQLVSAHTGCGFSNVSMIELSRFSPLAIVGVIIAMMIGGAVCSTAGAIKLMRVGVILKSIFFEVRRWIMPAKAVYVSKIHHLQETTLNDKRVMEAFQIMFLYLFVYVAGAVAGMLTGMIRFWRCLSRVSAAANIGRLSTGLTIRRHPLGLKVGLYFYRCGSAGWNLCRSLWLLGL